jgi:hypothetical protein
MRRAAVQEALAGMLAGLRLLQDAKVRFYDQVDRELRREPSLTPSQAEIRALTNHAGRTADADARRAHDQIQSYGTVATALLLAEFLGVGIPDHPDEGVIGGGVKRDAGAPAPRGSTDPTLRRGFG